MTSSHYLDRRRQMAERNCLYATGSDAGLVEGAVGAMSLRRAGKADYVDCRRMEVHCSAST